MDKPAFEAEADASDWDVDVVELFNELPVPVKDLIVLSIAVGVHVLKLGVLVVALSGCVATYCLGLTWICLFWFQTKLLLVTAALLRKCLEEPIINCELEAPRQKVSTADRERTPEKELKINPSEHPQIEQTIVEPVINTTENGTGRANQLISNSKASVPQSERGTTAQAQAVDASGGQSFACSQSEPDEILNRILHREKEAQAAVSDPMYSHHESWLCEDGSDEGFDHLSAHVSELGSSDTPAAPLETERVPETAKPDAIDEQNGISPLLGKHSKEEKKVAEQAAWLTRLAPKDVLVSKERSALVVTAGQGSVPNGLHGTAAANQQTHHLASAFRFSNEQVAEAASFAKLATRGGYKHNPPSRATQNSKSSVRGKGNSFLIYGNAVKSTSSSVNQQKAHCKPSSANSVPAGTLPPHLQKAKEARERRTGATGQEKNVALANGSASANCERSQTEPYRSTSSKHPVTTPGDGAQGKLTIVGNDQDGYLDATSEGLHQSSHASPLSAGTPLAPDEDHVSRTMEKAGPTAEVSGPDHSKEGQIKFALGDVAEPRSRVSDSGPPLLHSAPRSISIDALKAFNTSAKPTTSDAAQIKATEIGHDFAGHRRSDECFQCRRCRRPCSLVDKRINEAQLVISCPSDSKTATLTPPAQQDKPSLGPAYFDSNRSLQMGNSGTCAHPYQNTERTYSRHPAAAAHTDSSTSDGPSSVGLSSNVISGEGTDAGTADCNRPMLAYRQELDIDTSNGHGISAGKRAAGLPAMALPTSPDTVSAGTSHEKSSLEKHVRSDEIEYCPFHTTSVRATHNPEPTAAQNEHPVVESVRNVTLRSPTPYDRNPGILAHQFHSTSTRESPGVLPFEQTHNADLSTSSTTVSTEDIKPRSTSAERVQAVKQAAGALNEQARHNHESISGKAGAQTPQIPFAMAKLVNENRAKSKSCQQGANPANGYQHPDLLDLDFRFVSATELPREDKPLNKRDSGLDPAALPFFAPTPDLTKTIIAPQQQPRLGGDDKFCTSVSFGLSVPNDIQSLPSANILSWESRLASIARTAGLRASYSSSQHSAVPMTSSVDTHPFFPNGNRFHELQNNFVPTAGHSFFLSQSAPLGAWEYDCTQPDYTAHVAGSWPLAYYPTQSPDLSRHHDEEWSASRAVPIVRPAILPSSLDVSSEEAFPAFLSKQKYATALLPSPVVQTSGTPSDNPVVVDGSTNEGKTTPLSSLSRSSQVARAPTPGIGLPQPSRQASSEALVFEANTELNENIYADALGRAFEARTKIAEPKLLKNGEQFLQQLDKEPKAIRRRLLTAVKPNDAVDVVRDFTTKSELPGKQDAGNMYFPISEVVAERQSSCTQSSGCDFRPSESSTEISATHDANTQACNFWGILAQGNTKPDPKIMGHEFNVSDATGTHRTAEKKTKTDIQVTLKRKRRQVREALQEAWWVRETTRRQVQGNWSLDGIRVLEKTSQAYIAKREELMQCMVDGGLNSEDAKVFPYLSLTDLSAPKARPDPVETARQKIAPVPEAATPSKVSDVDTSTAGRDGLREKVEMALELLRDAQSSMREAKPTTKQNLKQWKEQSAAKVSRATKFYRKKRGALEEAFPFDPWLKEKLPKI